MSRPNIAFSVRASSGTIRTWMGSAMMTGWCLVLLGGGDFWSNFDFFRSEVVIRVKAGATCFFFPRDFSGTSIQSIGAQC